MLESFHGAFDGGKLDRILSESMLVGFGGSWKLFSPVLETLRARWRSVVSDLGSLLV